jgi:hypothetical protein
LMVVFASAEMAVVAIRAAPMAANRNVFFIVRTLSSWLSLECTYQSTIHLADAVSTVVFSNELGVRLRLLLQGSQSELFGEVRLLPPRRSVDPDVVAAEVLE